MEEQGADAPRPGHSTATPAITAQLLATEHWSLLAQRSTIWSEVMSRIAIHLTVASASLVVLALVAQANGFGPAFHILSIGLASAVLVLGTLTGIRVHLASAADWPTAVIVLVGIACGVLYLGSFVLIGRRSFDGTRLEVRNPRPEATEDVGGPT